MLIFSGGPTNAVTRQSEAGSYLSLCTANNFWNLLPNPHHFRILLEPNALDSFSNLLFSTILFWRTTNTWPEKITIVSQGFKRARFLESHVPAMRWAGERVVFTGKSPWDVGICEVSGEEKEGVLRGEYENVRDACYLILVILSSNPIYSFCSCLFLWGILSKDFGLRESLSNEVALGSYAMDPRSSWYRSVPARQKTDSQSVGCGSDTFYLRAGEDEKWSS